MTTPHEGETPNRNVRVADSLWTEYLRICGAAGTSASADLREYMQRRVDQQARIQESCQCRTAEQFGPNACDHVWCPPCQEWHRDNGGRLVGCDIPFVYCNTCRLMHQVGDCGRFGN